MNKSKFLKKSLALLLAFMLVFAMIPLGAAAADSPSINGAYVLTDGSARSDLKVEGTTITGTIPTSATTIVLNVLVQENTTNTAKVSYRDMLSNDKPWKSMTPDANNTLWSTPSISFSKNDFQIDDDTVEMEIYVQYENNPDSEVVYTVTLTREVPPSDATVTNLRVWTSGNINDGGLDVKGVPQLGNTVINQVDKIIDITVPYNTKSVWLRDIDIVEGAEATIDGVLLENEVRIISDFSVPTGATGITSVANPTNQPNVVTVPVKVTAGTHTNTYTLRLTLGSGIESFTVKDAIDSRVFPAEGVIVVVMPFGYRLDNTVGTTLTLTPEFNLQYSETEVPNLYWTGVSGALKSGETKINVTAGNISMAEYDYTDPDKRLQKAESFDAWKKANGNATFPSQNPSKLTVEYVEDTERKYDLVIVEPIKNYESKITMFDIGTETAEIDQTNKTINIELPAGADKSRIDVSDITIQASDAAAITFPLQNGVKVEEQGSHASAHTGSDRSVSAEYKKAAASDATLNATNQVIVRVTSQDASTISDYKLNVTVNSSYVKPGITSLTMQSADGKTTFTGELNDANGIYTVKVPYKFKSTQDLAGFKVFYQKTAGATVTAYDKTPAAVTSGTGAWGKVTGFTLDGSEMFLHNGGKNDGTTFSTIESNAKDTSTKGTKIVAQVRNPLTNQLEEKVYYILLVRETPSTNSRLSEFALTANGTNTTAMSMKNVNDDNRYPGKIVGDKITVSIPWSHYIQNGEDIRASVITETHILDAIHFIAKTADKNATVWYAFSSGTHAYNGALIPEEGCDALYQTMVSHESDLRIYVLSEQLSVDLQDEIDPSGVPALTNAGTINNKIAIDDIVTSGTADKLYTVYTLEVKQADPQASHQLSSVKLMNYNSKYGVRSADLRITGNTISGTIPYSFVGEKLYLDYTASPRAFVMGGDDDGADETFDHVFAGADPLTQSNSTPKYPNATVGHFCDWSVDYDTSSNANSLNCSLLPTGGAYIQIDAAGTVTMGYRNSSDPIPATINKLVVTNEGGTKGADVYTLKVDVAPQKNENLITSFKLAGQIGNATINNDTDTINVTIPSTLERTAIKTTWTLSDGAYMADYNAADNDQAFNYTTERLFTVVAENGTDKRTYRVNVTVQRGFTDVQEGDWFYDAVMKASDLGWINGKGDGIFDPKGGMKRGDFAMLIANIKQYDEEAYKDTTRFPDVSADSYYAGAIAWCVDQGYIDGYDDGNFKPNNLITREQVAKIMCNAADLNPASGNTKFADDAKIAGWAKPYINACVSAGIISGKENNLYDPKTNLKRCEAAQLVVDAFSK